MSLCYKRKPNGILRCELERVHKGDHGAWITQPRQSESESPVLTWVTWPNLDDKATPKLKRTRVRQTSDKQEPKKAAWKLIRNSMLIAQERTQGFTSCMFCGGQFGRRQLQLAHLIAAGKGGAWEPHNAALACAGPGTNLCHEKYDNNLPKWSRAS